MHGLAGADDRGVAATLAPIVCQLHRQTGERVVGWRGDGRCDIIDAKTETVSDLANRVFGRCLVGKQIKLPRSLVFRAVLT
jgi:hypothetical protein